MEAALSVIKSKSRPRGSTVWGRAWKSTDRGKLPPDFLELEFSSWAEGAPRTGRNSRLSLGVPNQLLKATDEMEFHDRLLAVRESIHDARAEACVIRLPGTWTYEFGRDGGVARERCMRALDFLTKDSPVRIWFEPGSQGPPAWLPPKLCVTDPLWRPRGAYGSYWKIHGWHPERWVRKYSPDELRWLMALARKRNPSYVILAHSLRAQQLQEVREMLSQER